MHMAAHVAPNRMRTNIELAGYTLTGSAASHKAFHAHTFGMRANLALPIARRIAIISTLFRNHGIGRLKKGRRRKALGWIAILDYVVSIILPNIGCSQGQSRAAATRRPRARH